jgi:hypothetical protein
MRWSKLPYDTDGAERMRCKFLIWPLRIGNEVRWLERAKWLECYQGEWYPTIWL